MRMKIPHIQGECRQPGYVQEVIESIWKYIIKQEACWPIQPADHSNYSVLQQIPACGC